jgi:pSer/pThr/pTyr-binding forkhead associated (FHA) protein
VFVSVAFLVLPGGSRVELRGDAVLGRSWVASIFPNAPWLSHISEAHAVIRRKTDGWYIEDLGSQYGTYVNGRDIRGAGEVKLNPGDVISLGGVFTLVFQT